MSSKDSELRRWLERILRMIVHIKASTARNEWELETVSNELLDAKEYFEHERLADVQTSKGESRASESGSEAGNSSYVRTGVQNIIIEHDDDGSMLLHLDNNGLPVQLQGRQRLRELVLVLGGKTSHVNAQTNGDPPLVPFKTYEELIDAMRELSGAKISLTNLQGLVQQLRRRLLDARLDPRAVGTGEGGYRICLRRDGEIHEHGRLS